MVDNQRVRRIEVKTRFRFSSEGGVGEKTRFGGGRFVVGTPSPPLHKPFFTSLPLHKPFFTSPPLHKPFFYLSPITQTFLPNLHNINILSHPLHPPLHTPQKNRIDINQSYLKHDLIYCIEVSFRFSRKSLNWSLDTSITNPAAPACPPPPNLLLTSQQSTPSSTHS